MLLEVTGLSLCSCVSSADAFCTRLKGLVLQRFVLLTHITSSYGGTLASDRFLRWSGLDKASEKGFSCGSVGKPSVPAFHSSRQSTNSIMWIDLQVHGISKVAVQWHLLQHVIHRLQHQCLKIIIRSLRCWWLNIWQVSLYAVWEEDEHMSTSPGCSSPRDLNIAPLAITAVTHGLVVAFWPCLRKRDLEPDMPTPNVFHKDGHAF